MKQPMSTVAARRTWILPDSVMKPMVATAITARDVATGPSKAC